MKPAPLFALLLLAIPGCDKPEPAADKPAPSASASAPAVPTTPPPAPSAPAPSGAPSASAAAAPAGPTKDAVASVFDPAKEPARTVKVLAGGSVALYLPEWAQTTWKISQPDHALGKPKDETIPGFAGPSTPAHALTWQIKDALKGQTHKVQLANAAKGLTFTLTIEVS